MAVLLDRILDVLECCTQVSEGRSITEISELLDLHKSTVSRLANSLVERGYLMRNVQSKRFMPGVKCVELSYAFLNNLDICQVAHPIMMELSNKTKRTAFLALRQGFDVVYIDKADGLSGLQRMSIIGERAPIHATALGKALLFQLNKAELEQFFASYHFKALTLQTKITAETLIEDILVSQERGYALDEAEINPDVRCIAAPIYDCQGMICAALSFSATFQQWGNTSMGEFGSLLRQGAFAISSKLGYKANFI